MNTLLIFASIALNIAIVTLFYKFGYHRGVSHATDDCFKDIEEVKNLAQDEGYKRGFADGERQGYNDGRRYEAIAQHNAAYIASKHGKVYGEEATEV